MGLIAVHFSKQHSWLKISIIRKLGAPRLEPGPDGREVESQPLCYATNESDSNQKVSGSNPRAVKIFSETK